ncbi:MAG TPA: NAD(P)/FAD-dependent oxidoreductase [Alphaproteobacteria bacterium]|nr:NAD(P)/FAD-dependent oxidoreductase [Alphaproteobacteria bacterium]
MTEDQTSDRRVIVIGAGPAGLTAAYELARYGQRPTVLEKQPIVGGLARTEQYNGFHFDMGGHRFFTKSEAVKKLWHEVLGDDFLRRPRLSRIYYHQKFFAYPLKPFNALQGLGFLESIVIVLSYLRWQLLPHRPVDTFEQWVTNRFGKRLFLTFFKTYTEKVWGIPCSELKAEWAAQRIKDLSLKTAVLSMFLKPNKTIKTLIEEFDYPRLGPGMLWNAVKDRVEKQGGQIWMNTDVVSIHRRGNRISGLVVSREGHREVMQGTDFISSMPVTEFIQKLDPPPPAVVLEAAANLHYRDFLTVCLVVDKPDLFPDNWIYIHAPEVKVARIQNFKNWSPDMVPDSMKSSLGLEYFCTEGDPLWSMPDVDLIELGKREVERIGLASSADIQDGCVFRVPKSYPVYDSDYRGYLATIRDFVDGLENFQTIGRNGLHRYNNQDHAMLTGLLAVRNLVRGEKNDLWSVNTDQEYHEEIRADADVELPDIPERLQVVLKRVFLKLDRVAFGCSLGTVSGIFLFLVTFWLTVQGGDTVGPHLQLLSHYFPGYNVSGSGSVIGLVYGFVAGFVGGWVYAFLRNVSVFLYMATLHRSAELHLLRKLFEYI